jgi:hypothetical protein
MDTQKYTQRRSRESWQELIQQWEASQMTAKAWCLQNEVAYDSFIIWRKRLRDALQGTATSPKIPVVELVDASATLSGIEMRINGLRLILCKDFDPSTLLRCLQVLEKL